jgi:argininosuccinate lyase
VSRIVGAGAASGGAQLLPEVLAFSSSLPLDRQLLQEDIVGSLAHLTMLSRRGIVPREAAAQIRAELLQVKEPLPDEEDVHMAVETVLAQKLGETAGMLHTARSRNDQVALDLRLHVREQCANALADISLLLMTLAKRSRKEKDTLLPSYTHRQRAQPVSAAYFLCAYGAMFARDADALRFVLQQVDALPLGVGAIAGTSLPTDREITRTLLRFGRLTANGLDTVGDRDFALDFAYAAARAVLHAGRVATDMIDFCTAEFGLVQLDDEISTGSSMMPQKKNPDIFELIRGKSGRATGNLMALLTVVKGLPGGYNRDLQEDRLPLLETGPLLASVLQMLLVGLNHIHFKSAIHADYTTATDVAEALAAKGVPFRTAYKLTGELVRRSGGKPFSLEIAREIDPRFDEQVLGAADPRASVARKQNVGGTGRIDEQIAWLEAEAARAIDASSRVPRLSELLEELREAAL